MSNWLSQTDRLLQLKTSLEGDDTLILHEFSGTEGISRLFGFNLNMSSHDTNIAPDKIIGRAVTIQLNANQNNPRYFHGIVEQFQAGEISESTRRYQAHIMPWLKFLSYTSDCRIFQNKSVIDIAQLLFNEFKFNDYDPSGLTKIYPKREYCVQYRETALNFLERIFQEEGIFYFFKHEKNKHILMLADKSTVFKPCTSNVSFDTGAGKDQGITSWQRQHAFYSGKYEHTDYNFEMPDTLLHTQQTGTAKLLLAQKYGHYDYPGRYQTSAVGTDYAQQQFEAHESNYDTIRGMSSYSDFTAGSKFTLKNSPIANTDDSYNLIAVKHFARDNSHLGNNQSGAQLYENVFICLPSTTSFRNPNKYRKPLINGSQTALVVGPPGEELYTDKFGRVYVQFHWDRKGKKDEESSCWIRVAQLIAGKNWGALFMPRIGQEVVVHFMDGDPDRPLIIGSVYNNDNLPPYQLPFEQTQSGIKTCSTKGGGASDANELRFEDRMGQEEVFIQAQKDFNQTIKNNLNIQVGNQSTLQAQQSIELKVGSNSLLISTEGIFLNGEKININS